DSRRMPEFRNTNSVSQNVDVTFTLDLRPAYHHVASGIQLNDIQGSLTITSVDQIDNLGVFINGPASGGWTGWGTELSNAAEKKMWDDGSHGDAVAGDTIYTVQFSYAPDSSNNTIGQEFKFGIGGGDNESGYGLNHIENIDDSQPTAVIHSQWGSINPVFYRLWNYDTETPIPSSIENEIQFADKYELEQNYPNPFNPSTNIRFSVKDANQVTLTIYNMMGQKVQETVYNNVNAGVYNYSWDARDLNGQRVSTGIYFYKLQADNKFSSVKKMVFMK
ncbi:MAG: T9SS type A sorting domain-containing protein, partial [Candidatus Marinimicrobia bacterium]|nr:T9SS type A sorting domain-containing protein [Candidatus Neomarinimicrobiota bacterium]